MLDVRLDIHNKFNNQSFINILKLSLINLSLVDDNFCKKCMTKVKLKILKESIYVKETENGNI